MARTTYGERLAKAMVLDAAHGTEHRGDAVVCEMLDVIGRRARGEMPPARPDSASQAARSAPRQGRSSVKSPKAPTTLLVKSQSAEQRQASDDAKLRAVAGAAHVAKKPDDAKVRQAALASLSPEQLATAVDAAVVAGKISGTEAVALLERIRAKG
ncbi:hypothetical protein [Bradyrhizobium sp. USDA 3364]